MSLIFEYQAPKYASFSQKIQLVRENDYQIDLTSPSDYWFMVSHVERSPLNHTETDQDQEEQSKKEIALPTVIKRSKLSEVVKNEGQNVKIQNKTKQQIMHIRKQEDKQMPTKSLKVEVKDIKITRLHSKSSKVFNENQKDKSLVRQKQQLKKSKDPRNRFTVGTVIETKKVIVETNTIMTRNKTSNKSGLSKDRYPCPFAPRYQRQWEKKANRRYSSLSPGAKSEAEKQMGVIKKEKSKISEPNVQQAPQKHKLRRRG